jgi:phage tail sheath protein FI
VAGLYAAADLQHGVWKAPAELPGTTLAREGEWKNAAVRRLAIMIERSIERGLRWVVLEPMKRQLFAQVRAMTEAFLLDLWRRGALAGGAAEAAFFVRCDETTMPPEDLDMGDFVIGKAQGAGNLPGILRLITYL